MWRVVRRGKAVVVAVKAVYRSVRSQRCQGLSRAERGSNDADLPALASKMVDVNFMACLMLPDDTTVKLIEMIR